MEDAIRPLPEQTAKLAEAVERLTDELKALRQESREDLHGLRDELRQEAEARTGDIRALHQDFSAFQGRLTQIGFALVGTLFAAVIALLVAVL